jgi:uncharacterized protein YhbP (UPF0306 family)
MTQQELADMAVATIRENSYLTLGTTDGNAPWTSPVFYGVSDRYTFYFVSHLRTRHAENLIKTPQVAFAIFDSHQKGRVTGIQGIGTATVLTESEIPEALRWYRTAYIDTKVGAFLGTSPYRFFRIVPDHFYIADPHTDIDTRVEVFLTAPAAVAVPAAG